MTGTTTVYNIRHPNSASKAKALGTELSQMAADIEAALVAAQIPPVQPMSIVVAASDGARDAYWGVPASAAERLTLQNKGATTVRPDKGWEERYFAIYNATTNPSGRAVSGWYPIAQPLSFQYRSPAAVPNNSPTKLAALAVYPSGAAAPLAANIFTPSAGGLVVRNPGIYSFLFTTQWDAQPSGRVFTEIAAASVGGFSVRASMAASEDTTSVSAPQVTVLQAGETVGFGLFQASGAARNTTCRVFATYHGPATTL